MSIFTVSTLGQPDNQVTFNDTATDPYYRMEVRTPQKYSVREQDIPIPFESGVADFNTLLGQTIYVMEGTMYPRSQTTYDSGLNAIRQVSNLDIEQTDPYTSNVFSNDGYVPYVWGDASGNLSKQLFVKVLYVLAAESTKQGYVVPFKLFCKIKDPTIYGSALQIASTAGGNPTESIGSAAFPFKFPQTIGATYYSVSATFTNAGTVPTYPQSIDIYGPVTDPQVTNEATGDYIQVTCTLNSDTDHLQIQYGKDYLGIYLNGISQLQNLIVGSTFFKLIPGGNTITLTGSSIASGAYAEVSGYSGYSLA